VFFIKSEKVRIVSEAGSVASVRGGNAPAYQVVYKANAAKNDIVVYSHTYLLTEEMA
jgi:hypothetical protein